VADNDHLAILRQGVAAWNDWHREFCDRKSGFRARLMPQYPDLSGWDGDFLREFDWLRYCYHEHRFPDELEDAHERYERGTLSAEEIREGWVHLDDIELGGANLQACNLSQVWLRGADLSHADLSGANLRGADLSNSKLVGSNLCGVDLSNANLDGANLTLTNLSGANLVDADISRALMVGTGIENADLTQCRVYGLSAWDVRLEGSVQKNLRITPPGQPAVVVDDLEVAQFIYLMLNNRSVRQIIDTVTSKAVLILGRFTPTRKIVLDALRQEIRQLGYLPILFDFDPAMSQTRMETVATLAHLSRFIIADITDARTVLQELQGIVPTAPSRPVQPILQSSQKEPGMFDFFHAYPWFLPTVYYEKSASTDAGA
jgi:Pentapeptide repeats (8 copies)